jgi:hypothetical protein
MDTLAAAVAAAVSCGRGCTRRNIGCTRSTRNIGCTCSTCDFGLLRTRRRTSPGLLRRRGRATRILLRRESCDSEFPNHSLRFNLNCLTWELHRGRRIFPSGRQRSTSSNPGGPDALEVSGGSRGGPHNFESLTYDLDPRLGCLPSSRT